jgi:hypothetical protein
VIRELNADDGIISKGLWLPRSLELNLCDYRLWGKLKKNVYANSPHDLEALKQNIHEAVYSSLRREGIKLPEVCLKEFRHGSQQRADI